MIGDMKRFLDAAGARDIVVIPVLWNGALMRNQNVVNLTLDDAKLQSYIDNALVVRIFNLHINLIFIANTKEIQFNFKII